MAKNQSKKKLLKSKKKNFDTPSLNLICNINEERGTDDIEDCMAELSEIQNYTKKNEDQSVPTDEKTKEDENGEIPSNQNDLLWDPFIGKPKILSKSRDVSDGISISILSRIPNVQVEMARHLQMKHLSSFLLQECPRLRMPTFERWVIDSKIDEKQKKVQQMEYHLNQKQNHTTKKEGKLKKRKRSNIPNNNVQSLMKVIWWDPVIPSFPEMNDPSCMRLMKEIESSCQNESIAVDAKSICLQLCAKAIDASKNVYFMSQRIGFHQNVTNNKSGEKIRIERNTDDKNEWMNNSDTQMTNENQVQKDNISTHTLIYTRKKLKKPFIVKINISHYNKLWDMFLHFHKTKKSKMSKNLKHCFHFIIFTLLLRYSCLSGGQLLQDLRGGGMQGAIHTQVFQYLNKKMNCRMECFASPLNAYYPNYCSAFDEENLFFGSSGSFFDVKPLEGCFEANPPFAPGLMKEMMITMEFHLDAAKKNDRLLTFIIIVPTCRTIETYDSIHQFARESFDHMLDSTYFVHHVMLKARDHGYIEAAQHLRPTRFKQSQYDTSVIVLQSLRDEHNTEWWTDFDQGLIHAFRSQHQNEILKRGNDTKINQSESKVHHIGTSCNSRPLKRSRQD